ncbi:MAG TPA: prephenate dehydrogenase/arogenate dehydrogenase family protein, partial [Planctomycetaceae bacterium]|nr:prephenate dehydrogenase/arogenate dehydrogenase family protein [Planctomycetaceae bacterium]
GVAIVGVGLIGGSIAAALKARGYTGKILGFGRNPQRLEQARGAGLLDEFSVEIEPLIEQASLVVICTPVDRIVEDVRRFAAEAQPGTLITDAGSVKGEICSVLHDFAAGEVVFVGSHPMAGSEKNGFEYARADLFEGRVCIVTPDAGHDDSATNRTADFWKFLGMRVERLSPKLHDSAVAYSSHLPHLVAAALAYSLPDLHRRFVGTGIRDATRIAAGDPQLWDGILKMNSSEVKIALGHFSQVLHEFEQGLDEEGAPSLKNLLEQAKKNRDALDTNS